MRERESREVDETTNPNGYSQSQCDKKQIHNNNISNGGGSDSGSNMNVTIYNTAQRTDEHDNSFY